MGERAFPTTLSRESRTEAALGLCAPCHVMTILLTARRALDEDSILSHHQSVQVNQHALMHKAMLLYQPKPSTMSLCMQPGNHGIARASSTLLFQEAGQSPDRRLASTRRPASRTREGLCWADGSSQFGSCHAVTSVMALCSPPCSLWPSAVLASIWSLSTLRWCCGVAIARLPVAPWAWSSTDAVVLPAMRLCKHRDGEPGLIPCHCT